MGLQGGLNDIKKCILLRNLGEVMGLGDCAIGYSFVDIYIDKEKGIQGTLLEEMQIFNDELL